jgi:predicted ATPase/class 3 adenylate cyclase
MAELPQGTVTLVFTDIEGSTRLLASLGSRYEAVLATHRRLLREALSSHGGIEVDTQGDALFYAFLRAQDAVTAAVEAQRALASHDFGEGVELRVRMGIHTGEPSLSDEGYVGSDVHLGARISAVAWGGQVVVSSATAALVGGDGDEISLSSLGEHALKDIDGRVELYQVVAPGLEENFPALRSVSPHPTNLPARLAPLIGREDEIAAVVELLSSEDVSVVTLVGPGGTGKTRLALTVGAGLLSFFSDGVFFVDLSALSDASLVMPAIAQALSLREAPGRSLTETLGDYLSSKEMVLILDNFEQVMDAAGEVSALVGSSSSLKVVVTSREALRIEGEREFPLHPLALPSSDSKAEEILASPAVELFVARARAVRPGLAVSGEDARNVAAICRRLDGLPLAIELAAARIKVLNLSALAARLEKSLAALGSGRRDASARQRTLQGAIAWSYELLDEEEQRLFARLGVFAGGWSLEAAEAVCDRNDLAVDVLDGIASLVDKSLVRVVGGDEARFSMLETIREYALEMLEVSGEVKGIKRAHAAWFAELARTTYPDFAGGQQLAALKRLQVEEANVKSALNWAVSAEPSLALRLTSDVWRTWWLRGQLTEARQWLDRTTRSSLDDGASRAKALRGLSVVARAQGDLRVARQAAERSAALYRQLNDELGLAGSLVTLADVAVGQGDLGPAKGFSEGSRDLYAKNHDAIGVAVSLGNLGYIALLEKRLDDCLALSRDSLRIHEEHNDKEGIGDTSLNMGHALLSSGRSEESIDMFERAHAIADELQYAELKWGALVGLASIARHQGDLERAASLLREARRARDSAMILPEPFERELYEQTQPEVASALEANDSQATDDGSAN